MKINKFQLKMHPALLHIVVNKNIGEQDGLTLITRLKLLGVWCLGWWEKGIREFTQP